MTPQLKPSTAIHPPPSTTALDPPPPPQQSPALSDHSDASAGGEHTTSNFNLGRRYRPTPLPTPSVETPGAPPPAFPVPGGLAMTTPAADGARRKLYDDGDDDDDEEEAGGGEAKDDGSADQGGSEGSGGKLVRRTTGKGIKVHEEHQRSDDDRREAASEKIEASRQKARQAKLEEASARRSSNTTAVPPPEPLVEPSPPISGTITPQASDATAVDDAEEDSGQDGFSADAAASMATPEHEKPYKDYKREMTKHLQSMMGNFSKLSTDDKPNGSS